MSKVTEGVSVKARILTLLSKVSEGYCPQSSPGERQDGRKAHKVFRVRVLIPPGWLCDLRRYILCWAGISSAPVEQQCLFVHFPVDEGGSEKEGEGRV